MDRGLLRFPHVGGFGSERQDPEVSGEFETLSGENSQPTRAKTLARASLGGCAPAQSKPIGVQPRPPSSGSSQTP